jgi:mono/diheme cytochrome c family protein
MFPDAPPLWEKHSSNAVVGVSDDPPGETYWKVANGIRLTGMPAFKGVLTETKLWQVSLLLANADKPLPPAAVEILRGGSMAPAVAGQGTKK